MELDDLMRQPAWMADALCREPAYQHVDFFAERGQRTRQAEAKAVCAKCIVREECLAFACAEKIREGIYGGVVGSMRMRMWQDAERKARGRPLTRGPKPKPRGQRDTGIPPTTSSSDDADRRFDVGVLHEARYTPTQIAARLCLTLPMVERFLAQIQAEEDAA